MNRIAVVTGGNRGIGLETCRQLAHLRMTVILGARDADKGRAAAQQLREHGLSVEFQLLDVTDPNHVAACAEMLRERFGRVDVLVNNAGIFPDPFPDGTAASSVLNADVDTLRAAMEVNLYGPLRMCQALVPMMKEHDYGRVVNLSSGMGQLSDMNGCCPGYRTSKTALNALTRILADELQGTNVLVNSLCPGWVRTDMGGPDATREIPDGADTVVWLATLPDGGPAGGFFRDRQPIPR